MGPEFNIKNINDFKDLNQEGFRPSILFVDDEQNVLRSLKRLFIEEEYQLFLADSAKKGLAILEQNPVHLVIADYRMPDMNGVRFLKEVCRLYPQTVRMVLSGFADTKSIVEAINEGEIYKFIPKPWDNEPLKQTIQNAIEHYCLFEENRRLTTIIRKQNKELRQLNEELEENVITRTEDLLSQNKINSLSQLALNCLPAPVIAFDSRGTVTLANDRVCELVGKPLLKVKACDFLPEGLLLVIQQILDGQNKQKEYNGALFHNFTGKAVAVRFSTIDPKDGAILLLLPEGREEP